MFYQFENESMFSSKKYQVQSGDTLTHIARTFGLPSWRNIYDSPENKTWRMERGSPDNIKVGDLISIPPNPLKVLDYQLQKMIKLREETNKMFQQLAYQAKVDYQKIKQKSAGLDMTAALLQLGIGYSKIVKGGMDTMKLTGAELAKANRELAKSAMTTGPQFVAEQVIQQSSFIKVTGEEGLALALGKIAINSWFDMTSPSYWAKRISGIDIDQQYLQTSRSISQTHQESIRKLDARISEIRKEILMLR